MNAPTKLAVAVALPLALGSTLLALKAAPMPTSDGILEVHDASLTTYLVDAATNVQGVRPAVFSRAMNLDGSLRSAPFLPVAIAGNPFGAPVNAASVGGVRLSTGAFVVNDVDLALPAPGAGAWSVSRSYGARQDDSGSHFDSTTSPQGVNWHASSLPEILLYEHETDAAQDVLYAVWGVDRFTEYRRAGEDALKGTNGAAGVFVYAAGAGSEPDTYVLTDSSGTQVTFFAFDADSGVAGGCLWKIVDPAGNAAFVGDLTTGSTAISSGFDAGGRATTVFDGASRRWSYGYTDLAGTKRLTSVVAETKTGGTWASPTGVAEVGRVEYEYYVDADDFGDDGDLALVIVTTPLTDSGVASVRKKLFRYYQGGYDASTNPGHVHAIRLIVDFEGTRRFDWQDSTFDEDFLTASNSSLEPYASAYFEYDSSHRIVEFWTDGECGCSGGGTGTHLLQYEVNGSYSDGTGYDTAWATRTILRRPDGSYLTAYHDEAHQALSHVITDADPDNTSPAPSNWATRVVRDGDACVSEIHSPSNSTGYTHSTGAITSSTSVGLVTHFVRKSGANAYYGFVQDRTWKKGTSPTPVMSETFEYTTEEQTVGGVALAQVYVSARHAYPVETTTTQGSGSQESSASRSYHASTLRRSSETRTNPVVSTAKNGSNSATSSKDYRELDGTVTWAKDEHDVLTYREHSNGKVTKVIHDADTTKTSAGQDFYGITPPTGYTTSGGIHGKTVFTYDAQGRLVTSTENSGQVTRHYYSKLADGRLVTLTYADFDTGSPDTFYGPVGVQIANHGGGVELSGTVALSGNSSTSALTAHVDETDADPITAIEVGSLARMRTSLYSESGGKVEETREYFVIPGSGAGSDGTNYDPTLYGYDDSGRRWRVKNATGTIQRSVFDIHGRMTWTWIGTNDSTFAGGEPSGTDNMVKTEAMEYDAGSAGGNHYVTKHTAYVEDSTTDQRVTNYTNDLFGRALVEENPVAPHAFHKYDNEGRNVATGLFSSIANIVAGTDDPTTETTNRVELSEIAFDEMGRAWKTIRHKIDVGDGSSDDTLESLTWRDAVGRVTKTDGEKLSKALYDDLGRFTHRFVLASDNDSVYADTDDVSGDIVVEERQTTYEVDSSEVIMEASISRLYNDYGTGETTGALDTNADADALAYTSTNLEGRIQITAHWYDAFGRVTDTVSYGTNGGSTFDRDGLSVPARSDTALRTSYTFNDEGELEETEDPKGIFAFREYDALGRLTKEVANYDASVSSGNPSGTADNQTVGFEYTNGLQTKIVSDLPSGQTDQETVFTYGTTKGTSAGDSKIATGHLRSIATYPDSANSDDVVRHAYNAQSETIYAKDQAGNVIETTFDTGGREAHRRITTLASGFDGAVRRISATYTSGGQTELVTQYDNATVGSGSVVDEVKYSYDGWGNVQKFEQDRNSAVGAGGSVDDYEVSYTYAKATTGRNTLRRTAATLPSGNVIDYAYATAGGRHDGAASRLTSLQDGGTRFLEYQYNGAADVVGTSYDPPDVEWKLHDGSSGFPDLDRFDRVIQSRWTKDLATDKDFYDVDIAYDRNSNITRIEDNVHAGFDVSYTNDDLDRLTRAQEGTWNGSSITSETRDQEWTLSHTGNWDRAKLDLNGDGDWGDADESDDTRGHNAVNELNTRDTDSSGGVNYTLAYDAVGNMTDDGEEYEYVYDAVGRMRMVNDRSDDSLVAEYKYNGLGYQVSEHADTDDDGDVDSNDKWYHSAYDDHWRKLATFRESDTSAKEEFIPQQAGLGGLGGSSYINGVVLRNKDANTAWTAASDGTLEEQIYYSQNWRGDVSALVKSTGDIVEWVKYSSYGVPFGMPGADTNSDGDCDAADITQIQTWIDAPAYDVRGDVDLDGDVDATDKTAAQSSYQGTALGRRVLSRPSIRNTRGSSGHESTTLVADLLHARHRVFSDGLGRWSRRHSRPYPEDQNAYSALSSSPVVLAQPFSFAPCSASVAINSPVVYTQVPAGVTADDGSFAVVPYYLHVIPATNLPPPNLKKWFTVDSIDQCIFRGIMRVELDHYYSDGNQNDTCDDYCYWHGIDDPNPNKNCNTAECGNTNPLGTSPQWSIEPSPNAVDDVYFAAYADFVVDPDELSDPNYIGGVQDPDPHMDDFMGSSTASIFIDTMVPCNPIPFFISRGERARIRADRSVLGQGRPHLFTDVHLQCVPPPTIQFEKVAGNFVSN